MTKKNETPKPRLSAVERLALQLEEAKAKEQAKVKAKLDKAYAERDAAQKGVDRAVARLNKVELEIAELSADLEYEADESDELDAEAEAAETVEV